MLVPIIYLYIENKEMKLAGKETRIVYFWFDYCRENDHARVAIVSNGSQYSDWCHTVKLLRSDRMSGGSRNDVS